MSGSPAWHLYVLCSASTRRTYVGISLDVERRVKQHNGELAGGAASTRGGRPWTVGAIYGPYPDRSAASRAERVLKAQRGQARLRWDGVC